MFSNLRTNQKQMKLKIGKKLRATSLNSKFTGSYKKAVARKNRVKIVLDLQDINEKNICCPPVRAIRNSFFSVRLSIVVPGCFQSFMRMIQHTLLTCLTLTKLNTFFDFVCEYFVRLGTAISRLLSQKRNNALPGREPNRERAIFLPFHH